MTLANSASRRSAIVSAGSVSTGTPTRYRTATGRAPLLRDEQRDNCEDFVADQRAGGRTAYQLTMAQEMGGSFSKLASFSAKVSNVIRENAGRLIPLKAL
jgi:hypothetical protein